MSAKAWLPEHRADEKWTVNVQGSGLVQVGCGCVCGDPDCWWFAAVYDIKWISGNGHPNPVEWRS